MKEKPRYLHRGFFYQSLRVLCTPLKIPSAKEKKDGFNKATPVKSFSPNGYDLYDMAGNVCEWCSDLYNHDYYKQLANSTAINPQGPDKSYDPQEPYIEKRSIRGGCFLGNDAYCSGYRVARRMKSSHDTGLEHTGFRCVKDKM